MSTLQPYSGKWFNGMQVAWIASVTLSLTTFVLLCLVFYFANKSQDAENAATARSTPKNIIFMLSDGFVWYISMDLNTFVQVWTCLCHTRESIQELQEYYSRQHIVLCFCCEWCWAEWISWSSWGKRSCDGAPQPRYHTCWYCIILAGHSQLWQDTQGPTHRAPMSQTQLLVSEMKVIKI